MFSTHWFKLVSVILLIFGLSFASSTTSASPPAQSSQVTIEALDYGFNMPDQIQAGLVTINLVNKGAEIHHAQLLRLKDGKTFDDFQAALATGNPEAIFPLVDLVGGPGVIAPGQSAQVIAELTPGNYIALCFIESPDHTPHFAKGMIKPFQVTGTAESITEPLADLTVMLRDFGIEMPTEVKAGPQTWKVVNEGPQPHEMTNFRLLPGKTVEDLISFVESPSAGPPPAVPVPSLQALGTGMRGWIVHNLEPGNYVAICFVPDPGSGKSHAELGMVVEYTVAAAEPDMPLPSAGGPTAPETGVPATLPNTSTPVAPPVSLGLISGLGIALVLVGILLRRRRNYGA